MTMHLGNDIMENGENEEVGNLWPHKLLSVLPGRETALEDTKLESHHKSFLLFGRRIEERRRSTTSTTTPKPTTTTTTSTTTITTTTKLSTSTTKRMRLNPFKGIKVPPLQHLNRRIENPKFKSKYPKRNPRVVKMSHLKNLTS